MSDTETQLGATAYIAPAYTDRLGDYPPLERAWEDVDVVVGTETEAERQPLPRTLLGLLGFVAVGGLVLGAYVTGTRVERHVDVADLAPIIETTTVTEAPSAAEVINAQNDKLLDTVRSNQLPVSTEAAMTVVNARAFCDYLATGHRTLHDQDVFVQGLYPGFNSSDVGAFEGMAVGIMCPRFVPLYQPGADGTS
ncbi:hypothetical protein ABW16_01625 [Mycolicibacter heraklionensis]|uniref:DUF732 domain-containing protein n=1 Tax=Mycolicibacter heraklionensis TaxID=512402 RepID=A0ABR5FKK3_9MYCO|nr:DUF732 domain-containing protein [Mycolicibacter heraklionensis]KLO31566.1 hypothetical protein ABW16_01625 [Mycolicibacter heraklionensis]